MSAAEHITAAVRLLDENGFSDVPTHQICKSVAHARIALALAVGDLADAAKADGPIPASPASDDTLARFVTAYGRRFNDLRATVDVITVGDGDGRKQAVCRCCGRDHGYATAQRNKVLDWADEHAANCMAMPQTTNEAE